MRKYRQDILSAVLVAVLVLTSVFTTQHVYAEEVIDIVEEVEDENTVLDSIEKTEETPENIEVTENSENLPSINNEQEENLVVEEPQTTEEVSEVQTETPVVEEVPEIQSETPIVEEPVEPTKSDLSEEILAGAITILAEDDEVLDSFDLSVPEGTEFPITLTFSANVVAGQNVVLLHLAGEEWERIIPDSVEDGQITATFNSLSPVVVVTKTEVEDTVVEPYEQTLEAECGGSLISVSGVMPDGITLAVSQITNIKQIEDALNDDESASTFVVEEGFDITLYDADGNVWQPMDYDQTVVITITNIEISAPEMAEVLRIEDDAITSMNITEVSEDAISFETEHFTQYIIGSSTFDTDNATEHWVVDGNDYYYYVENGQHILICEGTGQVNPDLDQATGVGYGNDYNGIAPIGKWDINIAYISEGFTSIGGTDDQSDLRDCPNLTAVYIPTSLTSIGDSAFFNDSILSYIDLSNVTSIGPGAFKDCTSLALTSLPEGVVLSGPMVFSGCSSLALTTLPSSITMLMPGAFAGCTTLSTTLTEEVTFNNPIRLFASAFAGVPLSLKALTGDGEYLDIPYDTDPAMAIGNFSMVSADVVALALPTSTGWDISKTSSDHVFAHLSDDGTTLIVEGTGKMKNFHVGSGSDDRPWADSLANITTITVGSGVTNIGQYFGAEMPALSSVSLPNGLTSIENYAFRYSSDSGNGAFTTINLPDSITNIGQGAFLNACDLAVTVLPTGLITVGASAFQNCANLTVSTLPTSLTSIGVRAFINTGISVSTIPTSVTTIGEFAFSNCQNLTGIEITHSCSLGMHVFDGCESLVSADVSGLTTIPNVTFGGCVTLANVTLSNSLTTIGMQAFVLDRALALTTLPGSITSIGSNAFDSCTTLATTLENVYFDNDCDIASNAFRRTNIVHKAQLSADSSFAEVTASTAAPTLVANALIKTDTVTYTLTWSDNDNYKNTRPNSIIVDVYAGVNEGGSGSYFGDYDTSFEITSADAVSDNEWQKIIVLPVATDLEHSNGYAFKPHKSGETLSDGYYRDNFNYQEQEVGYEYQLINRFQAMLPREDYASGVAQTYKLQTLTGDMAFDQVIWNDEDNAAGNRPDYTDILLHLLKEGGEGANDNLNTICGTKFSSYTVATGLKGYDISTLTEQPYYYWGLPFDDFTSDTEALWKTYYLDFYNLDVPYTVSLVNPRWSTYDDYGTNKLRLTYDIQFDYASVEYEVHGALTFNDNNDAYGIRPSELELKFYGSKIEGGVEVIDTTKLYGQTTVYASDDWAYDVTLQGRGTTDTAITNKIFPVVNYSDTYTYAGITSSYTYSTDADLYATSNYTSGSTERTADLNVPISNTAPLIGLPVGTITPYTYATPLDDKIVSKTDYMTAAANGTIYNLVSSSVMAYLDFNNGTDDSDGYTLRYVGSGQIIGYANDDALFSGYNVTNVVYESGITAIGSSNCVSMSGLTTITIPNSVTLIDQAAFSHCPNLVLTSLPSNLEVIGDEAFVGDTSLAISSFPTSLREIGSFAFGSTNLADTLGDVLQFNNCTIEENAFATVDVNYLRSDTDTLINLKDFNGTNLTTTLIKPVSYVVRVPATQAFVMGADESSLSANITVSVEFTGSDELANKQYVELSPTSATADLNADGTKVGEISIAQSKTAFHKSDASNEATTVVTYSQASPFRAGTVITSTVGYTYSLKVDPSGL